MSRISMGTGRTVVSRNEKPNSQAALKRARRSRSSHLRVRDRGGAARESAGSSNASAESEMSRPAMSPT